MVSGHYTVTEGGEQPLFIGVCKPVLLPDNKYPTMAGSCTVFTTVHTMDMRLINTDNMYVPLFTPACYTALQASKIFNSNIYGCL